MSIDNCSQVVLAIAKSFPQEAKKALLRLSADDEASFEACMLAMFQQLNANNDKFSLAQAIYNIANYDIPVDDHTFMTSILRYCGNLGRLTLAVVACTAACISHLTKTAFNVKEQPSATFDSKAFVILHLYNILKSHKYIRNNRDSIMTYLEWHDTVIAIMGNLSNILKRAKNDDETAYRDYLITTSMKYPHTSIPIDRIHNMMQKMMDISKVPHGAVETIVCSLMANV